MKLYHGTIVDKIQVLKRNSRDKEKSVLYLTDNRAYSLFYIRDPKVNFVTCGVGEDGKVYYDEKFPNQLEVLYKGTSGYIYETDVQAQKHHVCGIWLCNTDAWVSGVEYIPDVYQSIMEEIKAGNVVFTSYDMLTSEQKQMNHQGIVDYLHRNILTTAQKAFYSNYFPKEWEEVQLENPLA